MQFDVGYDHRTQSYYKIPKRVYASSTADRSEYRFHRHQYREIIEFLARRGIFEEQFDTKVHTPCVGHPVSTFKMPDWFTPRDYQVGIINYFVEPGYTKVTTLQTGKGKMQSLDSLIRIPGGWKRMGDIQMGDKLVAPDGGHTWVNGIFPHGEKQLYEVTFADGRVTEAGADHLWKVYYVNTSKHKRWRVVDTLEVLRLISMPNPRVYVPLIEPERSLPKDLPLEPWFLGAWLGDGHIGANDISFATTYPFILDKLNALAPEGVVITEGCNGKDRGLKGKPILRDIFERLGLIGKLAWDKYIPRQYLEGSIEQRYELLQGLMDTDGTANSINTGGAISYSTTSEQLAKDVQYLVRSLGGIAMISSRIPTFVYKDESKNGRLAYDVNIRMKFPSMIFTLPKKKIRTNDNNQYAKGLKLQVKSIVPSRVAPAQCISVTHRDHLYVTDDFIVTHNTAIALAAATQIAVRTILCVPAKYIYKWIGDAKETLGVPEDRLMVIKGSKALRTAIELGIAGKIDCDFIIISATTLYNYFKAYENNELEEQGYLCPPHLLYQVMDVGLRLIDEVHENLHLNFKQDLYGHVNKSIMLSATLESDDPFVNKVIEIAYPFSTRYKGIEYDRYIAVTALAYRVRDINKLPHKRRKMYSQVKYEESLLKWKKVIEAYAEMIYQIVVNEYVEEREEGQRMIIFADTKDMCTFLSDYIKERLPNLVVRRFIGEDPDEHLYESDIVVSTPKSAGTAVDIDGLKISLLTSAISSRQANAQILGRLRHLKDWPDVTPRFFYLVCTDIPKHMDYHKKKVEAFKDKVLSHKLMPTSFSI